MAEKRRSPTWTPFDRNRKEEGKASSGGTAGKQNQSKAHKNRLTDWAKQMPKQKGKKR